MIIVNQDKTELVNFENIMNVEITNCDEEGFGIFAGFIVGIDDNYRLLGYYQTEERAKEVLQEIVEFYECSKHETAYSNFIIFKNSKKDFVYEMPKE